MSYPQSHQGRFGIGLVTGQFYPHSFNLATLDEFDDFVIQHERCMWYSDVAHESVIDTEAIAIRHDVDHSIVHALRFAAWEADHGINASYYILPTAPYYKQEDTMAIALEMQAMGHEIGVHNDALTQAARWLVQNPHKDARGLSIDEIAMQILGGWVLDFREAGLHVGGCADHGGGEPRNVDLWSVYHHTPMEADLSYECYALHRRDANYISDNRGQIQRPHDRSGPQSMIKMEGQQTHFLIHPEHWRLP